MSSSLNNSLSFDVPIGDTPPKTRTPLRPRTPFRNIGTTEDLNKKLESASERRKQALEVILLPS
ncbi:unnamed protein product [Protopolystoma xenopodis]|uniref:Uncharacterized protein n=1 Tax=Protopolystoma xenopodis TaxID=117903 RepID=A0A448WK93_9PLAT|nr:unnamed protein product [Protopolystoma xenopodis]